MKQILFFILLILPLGVYARTCTDTVTVEEMKKNFYEGIYLFENPSLDTYINRIPHFSPGEIAYFSEPLHLCCPEMNIMEKRMRCEWKIRYVSDSSVVENERTKVYRTKRSRKELLLELTGGSGLTYKLIDDLGDKYGWWNGAIRCPWLTGTFSLMVEPVRYFGMYVTRVKVDCQVEKGIIVKETIRGVLYNGTMGVLDSIAKTRGSFFFDGTWFGGAGMELVVLADTLNSLLGKSLGKGVSQRYLFLIRMNAVGKSQLYLLHALDGKMGYEVSALQKAVTKLPLHAITPMWTMDGRCFPGRYLKAIYDPQKGWKFMECYVSRANNNVYQYNY